MSTPQDKAASIFDAAVKLDAPSQRAAYLDAACGHDALLRAEVEQLLKHDHAAGSFLNKPDKPGPVATVDQPVEAAGTVIGPYKLMEPLGEGGMGLVFVAEQQQPVRRKVALKVIKPGMDTRQVVARFEAERQALALMDHPNIAKVLEAGATESGRPYFVMELVKGVPITQFCDDNRLNPRERLELFSDVCAAVQHAHQKGIIHRDIKPSNVLVTSHDGRPVVKVIDFGVAKAIGQQLTDKTLYTQLTQLIGTPLYMSPEQAGQSGLDVDTRSDIYSLGVLLYELLTGTTPFDQERFRAAGYDEIRRIIREEEPPKPSMRISTLGQLATTVSAQRQSDPKRLNRLFRGELDWIVMKALQKDRNRRYETANGFAADVQRYLNDEPVQACPPSAGYRLRKFVRRNKRALTLASVVALAVLLVVGSIGWMLRDRQTRQTALEYEVTRALEETEASYRRDKLPEALVAVKRAEGLLGGGSASEELDQRVRQWRTDLQMVARLEEIPLERAVVNEKDGGFDWTGSERAYREVFRGYDLDVEALDPDEAAERVRASAIRDNLLAALHDWVRSKRRTGDVPGWRRLLAVARRADDSRWRDRFCEAYERSDLKAVEALARQKEVLDQPPATVRFVAALLARGETLPLAIEVLRQAQRRHPGDLWINFDLGIFLLDAHWDSSATSEGVGFLRAALALRPESAGLHANLGFALEQQGKLAEAEQLTRAAIVLKPDSAQAHSNLGVVLERSGQRGAAEQALREAIRLQPDYAQALSNLGAILERNGQLDAAIAAFREAIRLRKDLAGAHHNLGVALKRQGQLDAAIAAYQEAIRLNKHYAGAHINLGLALSERGKPDEAIATLHKAVELKPNSARAHYNLGYVYYHQGKIKEALAGFRKAIQLEGDLVEAHYGLGNAHGRKAEWDEAMAAYRKAIELKPAWAQAHYDLGGALAAKGRADDAIAAYKEAIRLKPDYPAAHINLGAAFEGKGRLDEAITAYKEAIRLKPDHPVAHYNLGIGLAAKGRADDGIAAYKEAIRLKPDYPAAHNNLGLALADKGRLDEAIGEYREAIRLKPDEPAAHYNLGIALAGKDRLDEAIGEYREAIRLKRDYPDAHNNLGIALAGKDRLDEAIAEYQKALCLKPDHPGAHISLLNLGRALNRQGKKSEARQLQEKEIAHLRAALQIDPKNAAHRRLLRNHYWQLADNAPFTHDELAKVAEQFPRILPNEQDECVRAAWYLCKCVSQVEKDDKLPEAERSKLARRYAERAVEMLRQSIAKGNQDANRLKTDSAFAPLRSREDFQKLVAELQAKKK